MTNINRATFATLMLSKPLPDGDVAAELLMGAHIETPVKMATPPNPERCRSIITGPFVKAATLAMSTNDPDTLDKLAKHPALGVKMAVMENPFAGDSARRIVEKVALKRTDSEMLKAVFDGASLDYIIESINNQEWGQRVIRVLSGGRRLQELLADADNPVCQEKFEKVLEADPEQLADVIGRCAGAAWPGKIDPLRLASICSNNPKTEALFLSKFIKHAKVADSTMVSCIERLIELVPTAAQPTNYEAQLSLQAEAITDECREYLLKLGLFSAVSVYGIDPRVATLEAIEALYGTSGALSAVWRVKTVVERDPEITNWVIQRSVLKNEDGTVRVEGDGHLLDFVLTHTKDDNLKLELVKLGGLGLISRYLSGSYGEVSEESARMIATISTSDTLRGLRQIAKQPWGVHVIEACINNADLNELMSHLHTISQYLTVENHYTILQRLAELRQKLRDGNDSLLRNPATLRNFADALQAPNFVEHISKINAPSSIKLEWVRRSMKKEVAFDFIKGAGPIIGSQDEIDSLLSDPGEAFGGSLNHLLAVRFDEFVSALDSETLDKLVDSAGSEIIALAVSGNNPSFVEYLSNRLTKAMGGGSDWMVAFELLTKSTVSIGSVIAGAKRLVRAKGPK